MSELELNEKLGNMKLQQILESNDLELIKQFKENLNNDEYPILKGILILNGTHAIVHGVLTTKILMLEKELEND